MKEIKIVVFAICFVFTFYSAKLSAQVIAFNFNDGSNSTYELVDVRKVTFVMDTMNLHLWDGSVFSWKINLIGNYYFEDSGMSIESLLKDANAMQVIIYPNPTENDINIRYNAHFDDEFRIDLYDMQGKLIMTKELGLKNKGQNLDAIDLSGLSSGSYIVSLSTNSVLVSKSIIKK